MTDHRPESIVWPILRYLQHAGVVENDRGHAVKTLATALDLNVTDSAVRQGLKRLDADHYTARDGDERHTYKVWITERGAQFLAEHDPGVEYPAKPPVATDKLIREVKDQMQADTQLVTIVRGLFPNGIPTHDASRLLDDLDLIDQLRSRLREGR